jgi:hypothetical protein
MILRITLVCHAHQVVLGFAIVPIEHDVNTLNEIVGKRVGRQKGNDRFWSDVLLVPERLAIAFRMNSPYWILTQATLSILTTTVSSFSSGKASKANRSWTSLSSSLSACCLTGGLAKR